MSEDVLAQLKRNQEQIQALAAENARLAAQAQATLSRYTWAPAPALSTNPLVTSPQFQLPSFPTLTSFDEAQRKTEQLGREMWASIQNTRILNDSIKTWSR